MDYIKFDEEFVAPIIMGKKLTTIRKGIKNYQTGDIVSLISTANGIPFASAKVTDVIIKRVCDLLDNDAKRDGFSSRTELLNALNNIYGSINAHDDVTIIHFEIIEPRKCKFLTQNKSFPFREDCKRDSG